LRWSVDDFDPTTVPVSRIIARDKAGERLTKIERKRLKGIQKFVKKNRARVTSRIEEAARLKFLNRLTWDEISESMSVSIKTLKSWISRHPEIYWEFVDKLQDEAEEEIRRDIRSARMRALRGVSDVVDQANLRLAKIVNDGEQDSVAMTAIKHVHGALGVSEKAKKEVSGSFEPDEDWKRDMVDTLGIGLAAVERAKQLSNPQIRADVEVLGPGMEGFDALEGGEVEEGDLPEHRGDG
jgi:hypothetical protein